MKQGKISAWGAWWKLTSEYYRTDQGAVNGKKIHSQDQENKFLLPLPLFLNKNKTNK